MPLRQSRTTCRSRFSPSASPVGLTVDQTIADGGLILGDKPGNGLSVDEDAVAGAGPSPPWSDPAGPHVRPHRAGLRLVPETRTDPRRVPGWRESSGSAACARRTTRGRS